MELYTNVLNKSKIYDILFLKIFTVSEYPNIKKFEENDPNKYEQWRDKYFSYGGENLVEDIVYLETTSLSPEYGKIIGVTLCTLTNDNGKMKRNFVNIYNVNDEVEVLDSLFQVINLSNEKIELLLCGHNILGNDIPFIIKRALKNQIEIPTLFKKIINSKPWESIALDTMLLWKFGSFERTSLNEIATFLNLKYKTLPMSQFNMNMKFHSGGAFDNDCFEKETMNSVNLTLQLMNKLRSM